MRAKTYRCWSPRTSFLLLRLALRTRDNQLHSSLLRLPAELRNRIYELCCEGGVLTILFGRHRKTGDPHTQKSPGALALRATCRQIRSESKDIFYKFYVLDVRAYGMLHQPRCTALRTLYNSEYIQNIKTNASDAQSIKGWLEQRSYLRTNTKHCLHGTFPVLKRLTIEGEVDFGPKLTDHIGAVHGTIRVAFDRPELEVHLC
jgi:hypothetical protein